MLRGIGENKWKRKIGLSEEKVKDYNCRWIRYKGAGHEFLGFKWEYEGAMVKLGLVENKDKKELLRRRFTN